MSNKQPLRPWVEPDLDEARIARQWAGVEGRLDRAPRPRWTWGVALASAALGLGVVGVVVARGHGSATLAVAGATPGSVVRVLADGSRVTTDSATKLEVITDEPAHVATSIERGSALFEVVHDPDRRFTVSAAGVEVRVVGTQFRVDLDPVSRAVTVAVSRGVVEVRGPASPGEAHRVSAGESWSTQGAALAAAPSSEAHAAAAEPAAMAATSAKAAASEAPAPSARAAAAPGEDARGLFEAANQARRAGDLARASTLYRELTRRYPSDPRVKVAALELARIEMDRDQDPAVAEKALRLATSAEVGSSVHEDALARLVQLYAAKGDTRACQDARARYLAAYSSGVHGAQVRAACAPR